LVGLWCLTPLSKIYQLYRGGQYWASGMKKNIYGNIEELVRLNNCVHIMYYNLGAVVVVIV
jgi:hypothetical protein